MERKKITSPARLEAIAIDELGDAKTWLRDRAAEYGLRWLLAHGEEGVIWGRFENGRLITSHEAAGKDEKMYCPELRTELLQQARLFGDKAELLVWRDGDKAWRARLIREVQPGESATWTEAFDEAQLLLGTAATPLNEGFVLWEDGAQGLRHAMPLATDIPYQLNPHDADEEWKHRPPCLLVRNYLKEDETGFVRVAASRLIGFEEVEK